MRRACSLLLNLRPPNQEQKRQVAVKSDKMRSQAGNFIELSCPGTSSRTKGAVLDVLWGWGEIAKHLRIHPRTAQRYEHTRSLPVQRPPGGGARAPVFAVRSQLDDWLIGFQADIRVPENEVRGTAANSVSGAELAVPVLNRIVRIGRDTKLYRRNYVLRFDLKPSIRGTQAKLQYEFELCNGTNQEQPYIQEMTIDDSEHGYVESMSLFINGKSAYSLKRPAAAKKLIGYAVYEGPEHLIVPRASGATYLYAASWVIHRGENDIWYNHMALPTVGVKVETNAPKGFDLTPSLSVPSLVMKGEHVDIAWRRRP